jgi:Fe-S cluster biogenesis protein NfuA
LRTFPKINQNTQIIGEEKMKEQVHVEDGIVKVRLTGACGGCPMSQMTLKQGIEAHVRKKIPEIVSVESV